MPPNPSRVCVLTHAASSVPSNLKYILPPLVSKWCIVDTGILIVTVVYHYTSSSSNHLRIEGAGHEGPPNLYYSLLPLYKHEWVDIYRDHTVYVFCKIMPTVVMCKINVCLSAFKRKYVGLHVQTFFLNLCHSVWLTFYPVCEPARSEDKQFVVFTCPPVHLSV